MPPGWRTARGDQGTAILGLAGPRCAPARAPSSERGARRARRLPALAGATGSAPPRPGCRPAARRRAPGLRREEVAQLAGLSVDYLARLEQGRAQRTVAVRARAARPRAAADRRRARPPVPRRRPGRARPRAGSAGTSRRASSGCSTGSPTSRSRRSTPPGSSSRWNPLAPRSSATSRGATAASATSLWRHFTGAPSRVVRDAEEDRRFEAEAVADLHAALGRFPDDAPLRALIADLRAGQPALRRALGAAARSRRARPRTARRSTTPRSAASRSTATSSPSRQRPADRRLHRRPRLARRAGARAPGRDRAPAARGARGARAQPKRARRRGSTSAAELLEEARLVVARGVEDEVLEARARRRARSARRPRRGRRDDEAGGGAVERRVRQALHLDRVVDAALLLAAERERGPEPRRRRARTRRRGRRRP